MYNLGSLTGLSNPEISNCTFTQNYANGAGGAIRNRSDNGVAGPLVVNCAFEDNLAGSGGAVANDVATGSNDARFRNCTFKNNTGSLSGCAVFNRSKTVTEACSPVIANSIFKNNSADLGSNEFYGYGATMQISYSMAQGGSCIDINSGHNNNTDCGNGMLWNGNPLFVDAANGNLRLQASSPAIDAGSNASVPSGIVTDMDGNPRFYNNGTVDMGAYENQNPCRNPSRGGKIAGAQTICYNSVPASLTSTSPASGEVGTIKYQWQSSTTDSISGFTDISGASTLNFEP